MSLFTKLFGAKDPLNSIRKALEQKRWADALACGEGLEASQLEAEQAAELTSLLIAAGDGLAELNVTEGEACLRAGDIGRAAEHFALAGDQARSEAMQLKIATLRQEPGAVPVPSAVDAAAVAKSCGSCSAGPLKEGVSQGDDGGLDPETRFELMLASFPPELVDRYAGLDGDFRRAILLAHDSEDAAALEAFSAVPQAQQDETFFFERGSLLARTGKPDLGRKDLRKALELDPDHLLAAETLVSLELQGGHDRVAAELLEHLIESGRAPGFGHGGLAQVAMRAGNREAALAHGLKALEVGSGDVQLVTMVAELLEGDGRVDQAEALLCQLPGGGCSGGPALALAEFWLRHGKSPEKALEAFKGALRQDPQNPRWVLRIGQAYVAMGWPKEGIPLLKKALGHPELSPVEDSVAA